MKCINCGRESDMSVCAILSTKGRKPRIQKSSKAISLCSACLRDLTIADGTLAYSTVLLTLSETYTALAKEL